MGCVDTLRSYLEDNVPAPARASVLMFISAIFASLMTLVVSFLAHKNHFYHWTSILWITGWISGATCVAFWYFFVPNMPFLGTVKNRKWIVLRGFLSMLSKFSSFLSFQYLPIGNANTLMFTSPVFTGVMAVCILKQKWSRLDGLLALFCFVGVILVVRPEGLFPAEKADTNDGDEGEPSWGKAVGIIAALTFAMSLAASNILDNSKLRGEPTHAMTLWGNLLIIVFLWVLFFLYPFEQYWTGWEETPTPLAVFCLFVVGMLFTLFRLFRVGAFQTHKDASVVNILYLDIVFAFLWQSAILEEPASVTAIIGGLIIMFGCGTVTIFKIRAAKAAMQASKSKAVDDENSDSDTSYIEMKEGDCRSDRNRQV